MCLYRKKIHNNHTIPHTDTHSVFHITPRMENNSSFSHRKADETGKNHLLSALFTMWSRALVGHIVSARTRRRRSYMNAPDSCGSRLHFLSFFSSFSRLLVLDFFLYRFLLFFFFLFSFPYSPVYALFLKLFCILSHPLVLD